MYKPVRFLDPALRSFVGCTLLYICIQDITDIAVIYINEHGADDIRNKANEERVRKCWELTVDSKEKSEISDSRY